MTKSYDKEICPGEQKRNLLGHSEMPKRYFWHDYHGFQYGFGCTFCQKSIAKCQKLKIWHIDCQKLTFWRKERKVIMRSTNYKGIKSTKKKLKKCDEVAKLYDKIQIAYADILDNDKSIQKIMCNVWLEDFS